jgi:hypothetical protein
MKVTRLFSFLAFFCLQSNFGVATDPAGYLRPLAGLWIPGNDSQTGFGSGVAISKDGNTIVVGASGESAAYVYVKPAGGWQTTKNYTAKLTNGRLGTPFGSNVAISGDTIVVSLYAGVKGAAYVFEKPDGGWQSTSNYQAVLHGKFETVGNMGNLAIDGDTIVAGSVATDDGVGFGVFVKPQGGWKSGTPTALLTPSSLQYGQEFGPGLAISGKTIIVGGFVDGLSTGSAFIYVRPSGGWVNSTETAYLTPSDGFQGEGFGNAVAIDGETAVVGAWENYQGNGAAYVFTEPSGGWHSMTETAKLTAHNSVFDSWFGYQVAVHGCVVAVGAEQQGSEYVYVEPTGGWQTTSNFSEELRSPPGLTILGYLTMGGTSLVTGVYGQTTHPSVVLVYGFD